MAQHAGTSLFDAEGNYQGDNPLSVEAMQFVHDLVFEHQIAGIAPADAQNDWFGPAYWAAFKANKFTMLYGPPWHIGGLQVNVPEQEGKWAAQRLPTGLGESRPTANFGGTGQCITEQSQNQDIAYDLIAAGNLSVEGNLYDFEQRTVYPAYIPTYERPELQEASPYFSGAKIGELYASVAPELPPFNQSPSFFDASAGDGSRRHHAGDDRPGRARAGTARAWRRGCEAAELALLAYWRPTSPGVGLRCGDHASGLPRLRRLAQFPSDPGLTIAWKLRRADAIRAPRKPAIGGATYGLATCAERARRRSSPRPPRRRRRARTGRAPGSRTITPYLFLAPFFIVYSIFLLYPVIDAFRVELQRAGRAFRLPTSSGSRIIWRSSMTSVT